MNLHTAPSPAHNNPGDLEALPDRSSFSKGDLYELCLNRGGPLADSIYNLVSGEVEYNNINSERESNNMLDRARVDIERIAECLRLSLGAINQKIGDAIALSISDQLDALFRYQENSPDLDTYKLQGAELPDTLIAARDIRHCLAGFAMNLGILQGIDAILLMNAHHFPILEKEIPTRTSRASVGCVVRFDETEWYGDQPISEQPEEGDMNDYVFTPDFHYYDGMSVVSSSETRLDTYFGPYNPQSLSRYTSSSSAIADGKEVHFPTGISIRLDIDPNSPTGISLDIGRDKRETDKFKRNCDVVGMINQQVRGAEGSHFTSRFEGISEEEVKSFNREVAELINSIKENARYQSRLEGMASFTTREAVNPYLPVEQLAA